MMEANDNCKFDQKRKLEEGTTVAVPAPPTEEKEDAQQQQHQQQQQPPPMKKTKVKESTETHKVNQPEPRRRKQPPAQLHTKSPPVVGKQQIRQQAQRQRPLQPVEEKYAFSTNNLVTVSMLRPFDVLLGRGGGPNDNEGNVRFRQLIARRRFEYNSTTHRFTKAKIAEEVVQVVLAVGGRFLKRAGISEKQYGYPVEGEVWTGASEAVILEKVKQALRQVTK
mmetsp:Transcript_9756/g.12870  ORF Transcript_9756/g.12870 Transcript_9756/m.12870 type:complete len:223 (+) Transcript_9756:325-993(+)